MPFASIVDNSGMVAGHASEIGEVSARMLPVYGVRVMIADVRGDESFADRALEMANWNGVGSTYSENAAGVPKLDCARMLQSWERPDLSMDEIRKNFQIGSSDDKLLLQYFMSDPEVDAIIAAGPIRADPRWSVITIAAVLAELVDEPRSSASFVVTTPDFHLSLSRSAR